MKDKLIAVLSLALLMSYFGNTLAGQVNVQGARVQGAATGGAQPGGIALPSFSMPSISLPIAQGGGDNDPVLGKCFPVTNDDAVHARAGTVIYSSGNSVASWSLYGVGPQPPAGQWIGVSAAVSINTPFSQQVISGAVKEKTWANTISQVCATEKVSTYQYNGVAR